MGFSDSVLQLCKKAATVKNRLRSEESTKTSLIMPFFQTLGYDVFNPDEFVPEFVADIGIKKGEKCDYAIIEDGKPVILIEAKSVGEPLDKHLSQLYRYFVATSAKISVLTNGIIYRFYTDLDEQNIMDKMPFFEVDLLHITAAQIDGLKVFRKSAFSLDRVASFAARIKCSAIVDKIVSDDFQNPSDKLLEYFLSRIGNTARITREELRPIVKGAFAKLAAAEPATAPELPPQMPPSHKFYILNTNTQRSATCDEDMLKEHKASAYYDNKIDRLNRGDVVFLYRTSVGIVAFGIADGKLQKKRFTYNDGQTDDEYFMHLDDFSVLDMPLSASRIREIVGNINFRLTMFAISEERGNALLYEIHNQCRI